MLKYSNKHSMPLERRYLLKWKSALPLIKPSCPSICKLISLGFSLWRNTWLVFTVFCRRRQLRTCLTRYSDVHIIKECNDDRCLTVFNYHSIDKTFSCKKNITWKRRLSLRLTKWNADEKLEEMKDEIRKHHNPRHHKNWTSGIHCWHFFFSDRIIFI